MLHIIKKPLEGIAMDFLKEPSIRKMSTVILVSDGVYNLNIQAKEVFIVKEHAEERGINPGYKEIDFNELVKKIFEHDKVYVW